MASNSIMEPRKEKSGSLGEVCSNKIGSAFGIKYVTAIKICYLSSKRTRLCNSVKGKFDRITNIQTVKNQLLLVYIVNFYWCKKCMGYKSMVQSTHNWRCCAFQYKKGLVDQMSINDSFPIVTCTHATIYY